MNRTLLFFAVLAFSACGAESTLSNGTFRGTTDALNGSTLTFDLGARTGTLTLSGGQSATFELASASQFGQSCPGNFASVRTESRALTPDPLVVGTVSLAGPSLRAGCGLAATGAIAATDDVVLISGAQQFSFERQ